MKDIERNKADIFFMADNYGWMQINFEANIGKISFFNSSHNVRLDVYLTKMTVIINISKKQISIKKCSIIEFEQICINPAKKIRF